MLEAIKFAIVGGSGVVVGLSVLVLLTEVADFPYLISNIFAFLVSVLNNYLWNSHWTFETTPKVRGYLKYVSTSLTALAISSLILFIGSDILGIYYLFSALIATLIGWPINFIISRKVVFA